MLASYDSPTLSGRYNAEGRHQWWDGIGHSVASFGGASYSRALRHQYGVSTSHVGSSSDYVVLDGDDSSSDDE